MKPEHTAPVAAVADPDALVRRRRWRTVALLASISVGWKVLVFTLGAAIPGWVIDDGIEQLPPDLVQYGEEAAQTARSLWHGPIERHGVVRAVRVMSADTEAGGIASAQCGGRRARVRAYTYFAIPYSEVRVVCDRGVVEYRVFRRKRRAG